MSDERIEALTVDIVGGDMGSIPSTMFGSSKPLKGGLHASTSVHLTNGGWEILVKSSDNGSTNWISVQAPGGGYPEVAMFFDPVSLDAMALALEDLKRRQLHALFPEISRPEA